MSDAVRPWDPLSEIEALQDDVLRQLDELNARLERTLAEFAPLRDSEAGTLRPAA